MTDNRAYSANNTPEPTRYLAGDPYPSSDHPTVSDAHPSGAQLRADFAHPGLTATSPDSLPLDLPKFAVGAVFVAIASGILGALTAVITNAFAEGLGLPWVAATFDPAIAATIAVCLSIGCASAFLLLVWQTSSANTLLATFGWLIVAALVFAPFVPFSQIIWPATAITAATYGLVVAVITNLSRKIGIQALR